MKNTNETDKKGTVRTRALMAGRILLGLVAAAAVTVLIVGFAPPPGPWTTTGRNRVLARYATMDDGVRLAVYVALPADLGDDGRVPAILESTRYGTMPRPTFTMRVLGRLGIAKLGIGGRPTPFPSRLDYLRLGAYGHGVGAAMDAFLEAGYAFAMASSRGSGASFGERPMELSREEVADQGRLIQWISSQDWSDGKVGAYGVSYSGNTAELACASAPAALVAAAPFYSDFDPIGDNVLPGGLLNVRLLQDWNEANLAADAGNNDNALLSAAAPVDGLEGSGLRKQAYAGHTTLDLFAALRNVTALDEEFTRGYVATDIASARYHDVIVASGIPLRVRAGWLDASTAGGALERFLSFANAGDGAFHVYLEDVAPDGIVTYITEGMLLALHRKPLDLDPFSGALGPRHSFLASDTAPLVPGKAAELRIALEPISVLVRKGHRIRIAVAGADTSNFVRIPAEGNVRITVLRDRAHASFVELPFMQ